MVATAASRSYSSQMHSSHPARCYVVRKCQTYSALVGPNSVQQYCINHLPPASIADSPRIHFSHVAHAYDPHRYVFHLCTTLHRFCHLKGCELMQKAVVKGFEPWPQLTSQIERADMIQVTSCPDLIVGGMERVRLKKC